MIPGTHSWWDVHRIISLEARINDLEQRTEKLERRKEKKGKKCPSLTKRGNK